MGAKAQARRFKRDMDRAIRIHDTACTEETRQFAMAAINGMMETRVNSMISHSGVMVHDR